MRYRAVNVCIFLFGVSFLSGSPVTQNPNTTTISKTILTLPAETVKETSSFSSVAVTAASTATITILPSTVLPTTTHTLKTSILEAASVATSTSTGTGTGIAGITGTAGTPATHPSTVTATENVATTSTSISTQEYIIPHRIPTQLEEKLEALSCDLPLLPNDSRLWKGNETHELLLPITVSSLLF